jgi:hypothetical protein
MDAFVLKVHAVLSATPHRWLVLAATLPEDLLALPPAPREWSVLDCLQHLIDTERWVFPVRIRSFLAGQDLKDFDPDAQEHDGSVRQPVQLAAEFAQLRQQNLCLLATVESTDLQRTVTHSALGRVSLGDMLNEWVAHDLNHTLQAERSLMQPFIAGCGAWRETFRDHDVAAGRD